MSNNVDPTSVKYNDGGVGFTSSYLTGGTPPGGASCTLPALSPLTIPALSESLTSLLASCKFQFPTIVPPPPIFIPKVQLPPIPCPTVSYCDDGSGVTFVGQGDASVGGSLEIIQNPDNPCCSSLHGSIIVNVPPPPCPDGNSFTGLCTINFVNKTTLQTLDLNVTGGPCNFALGGCGTINLPDVPCPNGTSFESDVSITTGQGTTQSPISIVLTGGPCDFKLHGGGVINIPCPTGMSFDGKLKIDVEGNGATTLDPNGNPGPINIQLTGGPCNWQLQGGGTIIIPSPTIPSVGGGDGSGPCEDCSITCCDLSLSMADIYMTGALAGQTPEPGDVLSFCSFVYVVVKLIGTPPATCGDGGSEPCTLAKDTPLIAFNLGGTTNYYARQLSTTCKDTHCPLDLLISGTNCSLYPGTVNGLFPTSGFGPTTIVTSGTFYVVASINSDTVSSITSWSWSVTPTQPSNPSPTAWSVPGNFSYTFGMIVDGVGFRTIGCRSLFFAPTLAATIPNGSISPNAIPYTNYYNWAITNGG